MKRLNVDPGQSVNAVLSRIRELQADLPPKAGQIAARIIGQPESFIHMSITEVAEACDVSEGTIVSFCRRVGVRGFQELKILLARDLIEPVQLIQENLHQGDDPATVTDHIFAAHAASLHETRRLLSMESLAQATSLLNEAQRIEIYGIGSSAPIAQDLSYRLLQLGLSASAVVDSHVQAVSAGMTGPTVATVTVSHSGSTVETVLATQLAREAGARTIGITRLGKSPLAAHCDVLLYTVANETRYRPEAMSSRVAQLAIIDTLVSCCALTHTERSVERLQHVARILSEKRF
ncbi:MurR/RpiR family transcriptional regulator [Bradyrhizobium ivorense]|uniref:MurR/RpiR family transcriptional regulator n=1 Tax=Bradyrhizobium ivorense TaxID=2511166 RepID=UPI0010BB0C0B|nr:MurR/RpiR family transcriptional regulator [Bradyrhizobium ivorense]VIO67131.1 HTH-type transcriptional regulator HexR [Bradyrhizobium ivorense]